MPHNMVTIRSAPLKGPALRKHRQLTALLLSSVQVHALHARQEPSKAAQIPLSWVQAALKSQLQSNPTPGAFDQVGGEGGWLLSW